VRQYNLGIHTHLPVDVPLHKLMFWSRQLEMDRNQAALDAMTRRPPKRRGR